MAIKKNTDDKLAKAKNLLKKAIASGDEELIDLATQALDKIQTAPKKGRGRPSKAKAGEIVDNPVKKRGAVGFDGNLFNPDEYANEFKNETEWAKKLTPFKVSARRPEVRFVELKCSRCNRMDEIPSTSPIFLSDSRYYVCNKCGVS